MNLLKTTTGKLVSLLAIWVLVTRLSWLFVPAVPWEGAKVGASFSVALEPGGEEMVQVPVRVHKGSPDALHLELQSPSAAKIRLLVFDDRGYRSWKQGRGGPPLHDSTVELPAQPTVHLAPTKDSPGPDHVLYRYVVLSNPDRSASCSFDAKLWSGEPTARDSILQRMLFVFLVVGVIFGAMLLGLRTKKPRPEGPVYAVPPGTPR